MDGQIRVFLLEELLAEPIDVLFSVAENEDLVLTGELIEDFEEFLDSLSLIYNDYDLIYVWVNTEFIFLLLLIVYWDEKGELSHFLAQFLDLHRPRGTEKQSLSLLLQILGNRHQLRLKPHVQ